MKRIAGTLILLFASLINLVLAFSFRDFSFILCLMFLFSTAGLPLGTFLLINYRNKNQSNIKFTDIDDPSAEDDLQVVGRFTINNSFVKEF